MSTGLRLCIKEGHANEPCQICGRWTEETQGDIALYVEGTSDAVCTPCGYGIDPLLSTLVELAVTAATNSYKDPLFGVTDITKGAWRYAAHTRTGQPQIANGLRGEIEYNCGGPVDLSDAEIIKDHFTGSGSSESAYPDDDFDDDFDPFADEDCQPLPLAKVLPFVATTKSTAKQ